VIELSGGWSATVILAISLSYSSSSVAASVATLASNAAASRFMRIFVLIALIALIAHSPKTIAASALILVPGRQS
jgi:hypothetical protein